MRKLNKDEIECRVAQVTDKGCSLLLYKTARVDRAILDELYNDLWQNDFKVVDGKMYGGIGVYNKELKEWIWRWDCGTESMTEKEKGQASDCFKRAGFKWGIGVELYSAPFIFIYCDTRKDGNKYKLVNQYVKYCVDEIGYSDIGEINKLVIKDDKGSVVYKLGVGVNKTKASTSKTPTKPSVKQETTKVDADFDLIEGLKEHTTLKMLNAYCMQYKDKAVNKERFQAEYKKMYAKLKAKENK